MSGALLPLTSQKWRASGISSNARRQIGMRMPMLRGAQHAARGPSVSAASITGGGHEAQTTRLGHMDARAASLEKRN
jgi:hypothetical protein